MILRRKLDFSSKNYNRKIIQLLFLRNPPLPKKIILEINLDILPCFPGTVIRGVYFLREMNNVKLQNYFVKGKNKSVFIS